MRTRGQRGGSGGAEATDLMVPRPPWGKGTVLRRPENDRMVSLGELRFSDERTNRALVDCILSVGRRKKKLGRWLLFDLPFSLPLARPTPPRLFQPRTSPTYLLLNSSLAQPPFQRQKWSSPRPPSSGRPRAPLSTPNASKPVSTTGAR